jgi:hypothetical protein
MALSATGAPVTGLPVLTVKLAAGNSSCLDARVGAVGVEVFVAELLLREIVSAIDRLVVEGSRGAAESAPIHKDALVADLAARPAAVVPGGTQGVGNRLDHFMAGDAYLHISVQIAVRRLVSRAAADLRAAREANRGVVDCKRHTGVDTRETVVAAEAPYGRGGGVDAALTALGAVVRVETRLGPFGKVDDVQVSEIVRQAVRSQEALDFSLELSVSYAGRVPAVVLVDRARVGRATLRDGKPIRIG